MGTIDLERSDPDFVKELARQPGGEIISACFACRSCVAGCPISAINREFSPAKIIRMVLYGLKEEILKNDFIWLCSTCYTCQERCPQGVRITELMTLLKNMAVKEGYAPAGIWTQMKLVKGEGRIYPIDDFDNKKRDKAGLPRLSTSCGEIKELFQQE
jgi:heterodisulfide reductase subunit C